VNGPEKNNHYPGFGYLVSELSAFLQGMDSFSISLKNGDVTRFSPTNIGEFKKWLEENNIRDITKK
jgi:hypothetical protein